MGMGRLAQHAQGSLRGQSAAVDAPSREGAACGAGAWGPAAGHGLGAAHTSVKRVAAALAQALMPWLYAPLVSRPRGGAGVWPALAP